jgi:hypothetical protein
MKELFKKYKKILYILILVVAIFVLYNFFFSGDDDGALLVSETPGGGSIDVGREILASLLKIRSFELDDSIFEDVGFNLLFDFSQEIESQPVGRPNPFSPVGVDVDVNPPEPPADDI